MRVTENSSYDAVRTSIARVKGRMENLQNQASSLKKLNTPSDDPVGSAKVLEIRTDKLMNEQFQANAKLAEGYLDNSDQALSELAELVVRAKEIALGQASGASSNKETRLGVAEEVDQLFKQAIATANRRIGDRYIFAGFKTNQPAVNENGEYQGDSGQLMVEIARDVFIAANIPGVEAFNSSPESSADVRRSQREIDRTPATDENSQENINLFNELQSLRISLLTGDLDGIRSTLDRFDQLHGKLISMRSKTGARIQGIQTTNQALDRHNLVNANLSSSLEDADMAQVVSDLAREETIFRSALNTGTKLIHPTLLDFLK